MNIVIVDNIEIAGKFQRESASECYEINSGSLNQAILQASPLSKRPGTVCPEEGLYDDGTIQILGTVKFVFQ
ncbi:MAG: hypothetical protein GX640_13010 [Fibrobacter sp.]|nr:hypothetical protein [Fibrobacter sp.]